MTSITDEHLSALQRLLADIQADERREREVGPYTAVLPTPPR